MARTVVDPAITAMHTVPRGWNIRRMTDSSNHHHHHTPHSQLPTRCNFYVDYCPCCPSNFPPTDVAPAVVYVGRYGDVGAPK